MKTLLIALLTAAVLAGCASTKLSPTEKADLEEQRTELRMHRSFR